MINIVNICLKFSTCFRGILWQSLVKWGDLQEDYTAFTSTNSVTIQMVIIYNNAALHFLNIWWSIDGYCFTNAHKACNIVDFFHHTFLKNGHLRSKCACENEQSGFAIGFGDFST